MSLKGMEFNFQTVFHNYGDAPAIITAEFGNGTSIKVYIGLEESIHAVIFRDDGKPVADRSAANKVEVPRVEIMPQVAPLTREEVVLSGEYVKGAVSSSLAPQHFRNQLLVFNEHFAAFKEMAEETWPGLQIRELVSGRRYPGDQLQLMVRDEAFVSEAGLMGHGLQMWLQTIWFLARCGAAPTVILDEPDVYMHPDLQRRLMRFLKKRFGQVIVMTHSVEIMSEVDPDEIIIVDKKQSRSRFAGNLPAVQTLIDHVGSVHNIHLARLWAARRCLFVEGKDVKLLSRVYEVLFPDSGDSLSDVPNMPIGGWGGWSYAVGSSMFLKNAVGQPIVVYCILDSDYHTEGDCKTRYEESQKAGVQLHIWSRKEIENYFLVPDAIQRAIAARVARCPQPPTADEVNQKIAEIAATLKDKIFDALSAEILARDRSLGGGGANREARKILDSHWHTADGRIRVVPGKGLFSALSRWTQEKFGVSITSGAVARHMHPSEVPDELAAVVTSIGDGTDFEVVRRGQGRT